jgi:glyoxylase-like metal-dependent hydrolase (beta-lactamase superfamily II)
LSHHRIIFDKPCLRDMPQQYRHMQVMVKIPSKPWPTGLAEMPEPLVRRVLAPNPSAFTFTGTQTYIVGTGEGCAVIDPGPDEEPHIDALMEAIGEEPVTAIMCTHTHRDHSPASRELAKRTRAPIVGCAAIPIKTDEGSAHQPRADEGFDLDYAPDRVLADGESVSGPGWTLSAVATPGHVSNHLCFALEESGALFTGDHVMGWSTSVIVPPDGSMRDYMNSLDKIYARGDRVYYPAHGPKVDKPHQLVRSMMGHRKQRERQIMTLIGEQSQSVEDLVTHMYKGLDPRLVKAAGLSVTAHLLDLEERGLADKTANGADEVWAAR